MPSQRREQIQRLLQREIADILRTEIDDPLVGFVTVTGVSVSSDLNHARVYVSTLGDEARHQECMLGLSRAAKFVRAQLAHRIRLRFTPTIRFEYDDTPERAQRIDELLQDVIADLPPDDHESDTDEAGPDD